MNKKACSDNNRAFSNVSVLYVASTHFASYFALNLMHSWVTHSVIAAKVSFLMQCFSTSRMWPTRRQWSSKCAIHFSLYYSNYTWGKNYIFI